MGNFGVWPQIQDATNPMSYGPFFNRPSDDLLATSGYPSLNAVKWVGKGNKGGCKLWFDCGSNTDKASCQAQGGICVWQKFACVQSATFINGVKEWYDSRASRFLD